MRTSFQVPNDGRTLTTSFLYEYLVSNPQRRVFFLGTSFQVHLEVRTRYWESRFRSFIEDSSHLSSGPRSCQLDNNCHRNRNFSNQEIPQFTRPPPFYKAHDRERAMTEIIFQALPGQTDRDTVALIYKIVNFCGFRCQYSLGYRAKVVETCSQDRTFLGVYVEEDY